MDIGQVTGTKGKGEKEKKGKGKEEGEGKKANCEPKGNTWTDDSFFCLASAGTVARGDTRRSKEANFQLRQS